MRNHYKIKFLDIALFFLAISTCLWSTTWHFLDLIKSSILFYLSLIFTSLIIIINYFNFSSIKNKVFIYLFLFFFINLFYFLVGLSEYIIKNHNTSYIIEYFIKQNISILFALLFYNYIFFEENIDKFIKYIIYTYIIIFSVLIYIYIFLYNSSFVGVIIDFDYGPTRANKNTLGIFICLLFPFILSYILKKKSFVVGIIFLVLYFIVAVKIDSTTIKLLLILQLLLYFFIHFKKSLLVLSFLSLTIFSIYSIFAKQSENIFFQQLMFGKEVDEINTFLEFETHRGNLFYSGIQKIKKDLFLGDGVETFRIREDNQGSLTETHNAYINLAVSYGIFGLFVYLSFYIFIIFKLYKKNNLIISNYDSSCIVYIISLLFVLNSINMEYNSAVWLLNSICLARAFAGEKNITK
tara:strand:+ start:13808 stop:15034 length:1227 start_codon:yes stop_codon:yes gene_type:complete